MMAELWFYWKILLRRLPVMALLFLSAASVGVVVAMRAPTTYSSSAELLVEAPQIPGNLAASTVQTTASEEITLIRQRLLTRANLIDIANKFNVFADMRSMSPDDVVSGMRKATRINSRSSEGRRSSSGVTLVAVEFEARNGRIAADVVNEYSTRIVEASVQQRTGRAEDTLQFFQQEVERLDGELSAQSARLATFQSENSDALPENLNYRMGRQTLLLERVSAIGRERAALTEQRERLNTMFENTGRISGAASEQLSPAARTLQNLQSELTQALAVYSESHPRIRALRTRISQAETALAEETGTSSDTGEAITAEQLLEMQLAELDERITALDEEEARIEAELEELDASIRSTPSNGITLASMQRDLETIRQQYDNATRNLAQARMGERIELTSRGQRITLIEGGTVPSKPSSPDRPKMVAMGVAVGGALAGGYFLLLEILNRTVRRPAELVKGLGIAPLSTIPYLETAAQRRMRRSFQVAAFLVVLIGVPIGFWAIDTYYLPLDLLFARVLDRFGIT